MWRARLLPTTLRGRIALAGLATIYIMGMTIYTRILYPHLQLGPEDLQAVPAHGQDNSTTTTVSPSKVLIVTSWFPVSNPLFTDEDYAQWLPNFFGSNTNDIYLYTTPQYEQKFRSLRGDNFKLTLTIDTHFASPFDVPPLKGKEDLYREILKKDREKSNRRRSSIELYANRHAKPFFLYDAVSRLDRLGKKYEFAFWSDAGSFRENLHVYTEWPSAARLQEVWKDGGDVLSKTPGENMIFIPTSRGPHPSMKFWTESMGPIDNDISIASFFGGMPHALDWFTRTYYAYHDHYLLSLEIFIGKNQALMNSLLFLFPERFITVWVNEPEQEAASGTPRRGSRRTTKFVGRCGENLRFYYEFWLAGSEERKLIQEVWMKRANAWRWWGWWKPVEKTPCKMRNVLGVETVLKSKLGIEWKPPARMVDVPEALV